MDSDDDVIDDNASDAEKRWKQPNTVDHPL